MFNRDVSLNELRLVSEYPESLSSVSQFVKRILEDSNRWQLKGPPWFRGQVEPTPDGEPLLPRVFQSKYRGRENELIQVFRMRAQQYGDTPEFSRIDQWLFLMQHCGLPTRLLDWTEGALIALYFAVNRSEPNSERTPVVWMLNPIALNLLATGYAGFSLTWMGHDGAESPVRIPNLRAAFENDNVQQSRFPVAVYPQPVHPRVAAQRGTFTVQGKDKRSLDRILTDTDLKTLEWRILRGLSEQNPNVLPSFKGMQPESVLEDFKKGAYLTRYKILCNDTRAFLRDLRSLGISQSTLFPEFDGLAGELERLESDIF